MSASLRINYAECLPLSGSAGINQDKLSEMSVRAPSNQKDVRRTPGVSQWPPNLLITRRVVVQVMAAVWQSGRVTTPPCFAAHSFMVTRAAKQGRNASAVLHSTLSPATLCESRKTRCSTHVTRAPRTIRRRPEESFHRRKKTTAFSGTARKRARWRP